MFGETLEQFRDFSLYSELRLHRNISRRVSLLNGNMINNSLSAQSGVSARVYQGGLYGFASAPSEEESAVRAVLKEAEENARFLAAREPAAKPALPKIARYSDPLRPDAADDALPQKALAEFITAVDEYIAKKYPDLLSRVVTVNSLSMEKELKTSDLVYAHSFTPRSFVIVSLTAADREGNPVEMYELYGGYGLFSETQTSPEALFGKIDELYEMLMRKKEGVYAEPGIKNCILAPDLAGILAHEAVGHTVEADFVQSGSVAGPNLGKQVASELVTLVDFAHTALGEQCPVPVYTDDEGTPAKDAVIIDRGILCGFLHNKESAQTYGVSPTGNARAFLFSDEPLIRMRNTAILPGKDKLEDMIAAIDDGYYFIRTGNGQADATGEFMFGVTMGYEIRNGKLGRALRDTTISGVAFDMLKTVDMLSDDMLWTCGGMCGKKQPIPVGMGGPAIKCRINVGGR